MEFVEASLIVLKYWIRIPVIILFVRSFAEESIRDLALSLCMPCKKLAVDKSTKSYYSDWPGAHDS